MKSPERSEDLQQKAGPALINATALAFQKKIPLNLLKQD